MYFSFSSPSPKNGHHPFQRTAAAARNDNDDLPSADDVVTNDFAVAALALVNGLNFFLSVCKQIDNSSPQLLLLLPSTLSLSAVNVEAEEEENNTANDKREKRKRKKRRKGKKKYVYKSTKTTSTSTTTTTTEEEERDTYSLRVRSRCSYCWGEGRSQLVVEREQEIHLKRDTSRVSRRRRRRKKQQKKRRTNEAEEEATRREKQHQRSRRRRERGKQHNQRTQGREEEAEEKRETTMELPTGVQQQQERDRAKAQRLLTPLRNEQQKQPSQQTTKEEKAETGEVAVKPKEQEEKRKGKEQQEESPSEREMEEAKGKGQEERVKKSREQGEPEQREDKERQEESSTERVKQKEAKEKEKEMGETEKAGQHKEEEREHLRMMTEEAERKEGEENKKKIEWLERENAKLHDEVKRMKREKESRLLDLENMQLDCERMEEELQEAKKHSSTVTKRSVEEAEGERERHKKQKHLERKREEAEKEKERDLQKRKVDALLEENQRLAHELRTWNELRQQKQHLHQPQKPTEQEKERESEQLPTTQGERNLIMLLQREIEAMKAEMRNVARELSAIELDKAVSSKELATKLRVKEQEMERRDKAAREELGLLKTGMIHAQNLLNSYERLREKEFRLLTDELEKTREEVRLKERWIREFFFAARSQLLFESKKDKDKEGEEAEGETSELQLLKRWKRFNETKMSEMEGTLDRERRLRIEAEEGKEGALQLQEERFREVLQEKEALIDVLRRQNDEFMNAWPQHCTQLKITGEVGKEGEGEEDITGETTTKKMEAERLKAAERRVKELTKALQQRDRTIQLLRECIREFEQRGIIEEQGEEIEAGQLMEEVEEEPTEEMEATEEILGTENMMMIAAGEKEREGSTKFVVLVLIVACLAAMISSTYSPSFPSIRELLW
ncbi:hypothetical protein QOT17_011573 [Balamuthia mandrillaris]